MKPAISIDAAWRRGYRAGLDGVCSDPVPGMRSSEWWLAYLAGWRDGNHKRKREKRRAANISGDAAFRRGFTAGIGEKT